MATIPPPASLPPPSLEEAGPLRVRLATALGGAVGASAIAAGPAALRVAAGDGAAATWIGLVALALVPMFVAVLVLRQARVSLAAFGGARASLRLGALALWLGTTFTLLAILGAVLRATTHHHALAGVTFACIGLVVGVGLVPVAMRLSSIAHRAWGSPRSALLACTAGSLVLPLLLVQRARGGLAASSSATCVDLLAFAMAALFASRPALSQRRVLALSGPPLAILALAIGLYQMTTASMPSLDDRAPAYASLAGLLPHH